MAAMLETRMDEAASHFGAAVQGNSSLGILYLYQAMALALTGRLDEAEPVARRGLELAPGWRFRVFLEHGLLPAIADKFTEGARLLGLPE